MIATKYLSFLILASLAFYSTPAMTLCSCLYPTEQQAYCEADFVVHVNILRKLDVPSNNLDSYEIEIIETYKMTPEGHEALENNILKVTPSRYPCGIMLQVNAMYVMIVQGSVLNMCAKNRKYNPTLNSAFFSEYEKQCAIQS